MGTPEAQRQVWLCWLTPACSAQADEPTAASWFPHLPTPEAGRPGGRKPTARQGQIASTAHEGASTRQGVPPGGTVIAATGPVVWPSSLCHKETFSKGSLAKASLAEGSVEWGLEAANLAPGRSWALQGGCRMRKAVERPWRPLCSPAPTAEISVFGAKVASLLPTI